MTYWLGSCELGICGNLSGDGQGWSRIVLLESPAPNVWIAEELLERLYRYPNEVHPDITLTPPAEGHGSSDHAVEDFDCHARAGRVCFHNYILRIDAVNMTVIYVVQDFEWQKNAWTAVWPD